MPKIARKVKEMPKTTVRKENWEWFTSQLEECSSIKWIGGQALNDFDPFRMYKQITVCCHEKGLGIIDYNDNKIPIIDFLEKCKENFPKK